jgi:hypothetical protein
MAWQRTIAYRFDMGASLPATAGSSSGAAAPSQRALPESPAPSPVANPRPFPLPACRGSTTRASRPDQPWRARSRLSAATSVSHRRDGPTAWRHRYQIGIRRDLRRLSRHILVRAGHMHARADGRGLAALLPCFRERPRCGRSVRRTLVPMVRRFRPTTVPRCPTLSTAVWRTCGMVDVSANELEQPNSAAVMDRPAPR